MTEGEKTQEKRLRRMAERQGLKLVKSRRRDPRALGYGRYMLLDVQTTSAVGDVGLTGEPIWSLDDVENFLTSDDR